MTEVRAAENFVLETAQFNHLLTLLLGDTKVLVGMKDLSHRYLYANHDLESFYGVGSGGLIGLSAGDLLSVDEAQSIHAKEDEVLASGRPQRHVDKVALEGERYTMVSIRFPYQDHDAKIIGLGFIALAVDDAKNNPSAHDMVAAKNKIIELQQAVDNLQMHASTDALTKIWNRRSMLEYMTHEASRHARYGHPVSIAFADLDHFKQVNDTWGHSVGDEVLNGFVEVAAQELRATDLLGRWGGEEFMILMPNTGRLSAQLAVERVRAAIEKHDFPVAGKITASFGIATLQESEVLDRWIERADASLYRAKRNGRNRIEVDNAEADTGNQPENVVPGFVSLIWRQAFECGHAQVDQQHQALFDYANQLLNSVLGGQPKDEIGLLIDVLLIELERHFSDEETVMLEVGYPGLEGHRRIHQMLISQAQTLIDNFRADQLEVGALFKFLAYEVVVSHLLVEDRLFFPYISAN